MKHILYPNRTQISLSDDIKHRIEQRATLNNESLSEYIRKSALIRMALEDTEKNALKLVANAVIGKVQKQNSGWATTTNIADWQRKERISENDHRS